MSGIRKAGGVDWRKDRGYTVASLGACVREGQRLNEPLDSLFMRSKSFVIFSGRAGRIARERGREGDGAHVRELIIDYLYKKKRV